MSGRFVGVPIDGEKICPVCEGCGSNPELGYNPMGGCDFCHATGVVSDAWEDHRGEDDWQDHCGDPDCTYCPPVSGIEGQL